MLYLGGRLSDTHHFNTMYQLPFKTNLMAERIFNKQMHLLRPHHLDLHYFDAVVGVVTTPCLVDV